MAIQVGKSWVSEAAYAYAKQKVEGAGSQSKNDDVLQSLSKQFPDVNFSANTKPFQGTGTNNIAIAPNILSQMKSDPDKRLEYEALIYDCASIQKSAPKFLSNGSKIVASGFIINSDGSLGGWSISQSGGEENRYSCGLKKDDKESWMKKMFSGLEQNHKTGSKRQDSILFSRES